MNDWNRVLKGFVGWIVSALLFLVYACRIFVPDSILQSQFPLTVYLPSKYWSMAIPACMCSFYMSVYFINIFWVHYHHHPLDSLNSIQDKYTVYLPENCIQRKRDLIDENKMDVDDSDDDTIRYKVPLMKDIPIHKYNELVYSLQESFL